MDIRKNVSRRKTAYSPAAAGILAAAFALLGASAASAQEAGPSSRGQEAVSSLDPDVFDVTFTVEGLTDYVSLRGYSQTDRAPALQGTVDMKFHDFHVGFFASNVDFGTPEPHLEFDPFVAWRPSFGNWSVDLTYYYYTYHDVPDQDYPEFFNSLSYTFEDVATVTGTFAYAPNYFGQDDTGYFTKGAIEVPLPHDLSFSGSLGYQAFEKDRYREHFVWDAGLTYEFNDNVSFDVRYHDTDIDADAFCTGAFQCGSTVVASVAVSTSLSEIVGKFAGR
ncbi:TorF family putative porin [Jiella avicenniae]|uniref:TorF family putative porin n=1 Tax=Jiella avicenniae TaxID=2907202 RepID=A0A9X1TAW8_9HYPH|nr:TorF family putative porin [Jiella avicenniae]